MQIGAAYIRVSTDKQDEYSLDSQLQLIRDYGKTHDIIIPDEYVFCDDGISGRTAKKRPAFNEMIALAKSKEHPINCILLWKFSRFARNQEESIVYKSLLRKNNVQVISISEPIANDIFGGLIERIIEWMDEFYSIRLSGEVKRGMTEKATRGEAMCAPAFGYMIDSANKTYIPHPDEAPIIEEIFTRYASGEGARSIAQNLNLRGIKTHRGNPPDSRFIDYIINNPLYIGKTRWSTEGRAASKRDYHNENIMIADGKHTPLVSMDLWNKVQEQIKMTKKKYAKYQRSEQTVQFMLKGLLRCSDCGATLVMQKTKCPSVQCHNYARGSCRVSHSISINKANSTVISALEKAVQDIDFTIEPPSDTPKSKDSVNYDKLIKLEENKLDRAREAYLSGIDTAEEYKVNKSKIQAAIDELQIQKDKSAPKNERINKTEYALKVQTVLDFIKSPDNTEKAKNDALRTIISKITYTKPQNELNIFFKQ